MYTHTHKTQEERQRALRHGLEAINRDLNKQARQNVAVWFPLGSCNERVLRIVSREAVLLNSREKVRGCVTYVCVHWHCVARGSAAQL
jgi:hypothetical protein